MERIFFATDPHGADLVWRKWLEVPNTYEGISTLMYSGDFSGKYVVVIERIRGKWRLEWGGRRWKGSSEEDLEIVKRRIEERGGYWVEGEGQALEEEGHLVEVLGELQEARLRAWLDSLARQRWSEGVRVVLTPGNDDQPWLDDIFGQYQDKCHFGPDGAVEIGDLKVLSLPEVNRTPWATPRELTERELVAKIDRLVSNVSDPKKCIFNFHCPPYGTSLDLAPKVRGELEVEKKHGEPVMAHVGSVAVRRAIEDYRPLLGLHGHIHESPARERIGETWCLNPGSEYHLGILRGWIIDVDASGVKSAELVDV